MDLHRNAAGAAIEPGAIIAGRYRAEKRVGAGGMGAVWSGEHLAVGVKVALKQLLTSAAGSHEVVARFRREAVFLGKIRSDHVARVLDFVEDPTYGLILVMEFIEGDALAKILGARTLSVEETIELGADISAALVDLHRHHIIHRDLKPGNIIWQTLVSGTHRAIIVDFGVSRILSQGGDEDEEMTGITRADMALGTIEYMAPEQILNSRDVTPASDIYALGAILYRAHAGRHVFGEVYDADLAKKKIWTDPPPLQTGRTDKLSRGLEAVVNRALTRSPKKRYAQADEILAELNMLRDLMKAASFDMDTMTTRDNSAILEALSAAESKKAEPTPPPAPAPASVQSPTSAQTPMSGRDSLSAQPPVSAPVQSSSSISASTASIPSEPPKVIKKGVSPAIAVLGFLVALVGGTALGTRLGPTAGGLLPAPAAPASVDTAAPSPSAAPTSAPSATATAAAAPTADATALPTASATAAPELTLDPVGAAAPTASASATDKPKLTGKLSDIRPAATATATATTATTSATTTSSPPATAPTSAPAVTTATTAKPPATTTAKPAAPPQKIEPTL